MDLSRPLYETYPWWLAIVLAFGIVLAVTVPLFALSALIQHLRHKAVKAQLLADHQEWLATHPPRPIPPPNLGRLTIRSRRGDRAGSECGRGPATPSSPEGLTACGGGVAPPAATGRERVPEPSRPVAPIHVPARSTR